MNKGFSLAALTWLVVVAAGVLTERLMPGSGGIVGAATAGAVVVFFMHRWTTAALHMAKRAWLQGKEAAAMAALSSTNGEPLLPWSPWALAPDVLLHVIGMLKVKGWTTVVECGSGVSTVILARELKALGGGHVYALEHDATWAELVRGMLAERGLTQSATVITAPLEDTECDGMSFRWYRRDCLGSVLALPKIDMLLVDGPKEGDATLARYPALPTFLPQLGGHCMVILDDGDRPDETAIARLWGHRYGLTFQRSSTTRGQWECIR